MAGQGCARWLVCSGALEFAGLASALALGACATSIQWAPTSHDIRDILQFSSHDQNLGVLVAAGMAGEDPCEAACALAGLHEGRTVLCVGGAAEHAQACAARGVTATVEPQGLVRLLVALHAEDLRACAEQRQPDQAATPEPQVRTQNSQDHAAPRQVRSQGGVPSHDCEGRLHAPSDTDIINAIKEPIVLAPVVHLSQDIECLVAGMDDPVPTVCVASARGGVGKSAIAVAAALALAHRGLNVSLIDLDFQFGTCLGYLGSGETDGLIDPGCTDKTVSVDARTLARCRCTPCRGLAAYEFCRMPEQAELLFGVSAQLVRAARTGSDVAVVDLPAGVNETVAQVIELSDRCLFVADQGALSLESVSAQQALCARLGIPRTKLITVMNRCDPRHRDEGFLQRASFETQAPQVVRVLDGGADVTQMLSIGHAADLIRIQNKFALSVDALMAQVCSGLGIQGFEGAQEGWAPPETGAVPGKTRRRKGKVAEQEAPCPF